jgi:hypothetical protein
MPVSDSATKPSPSLAYLDTSATAALTGISESTLEKQRLTGGGIPFIKAGRLVKYSVADIHAWMAARRRCSTSETPAVAGAASGQESAGRDSVVIGGASGFVADHADRGA